MERAVSGNWPFAGSPVTEIAVEPGNAAIRDAIPMPQDSRIAGMDAEEVSIFRPLLATVNSGSAYGIQFLVYTVAQGPARAPFTPPSTTKE